MKILVTGGSGFIGNHLSSFLKKNHEVVIFDQNPPKNQDLDFVKGNVLESKNLMCASKGCDIVIHLAAAVGVKITEVDPLLTLNLNIFGTKNVLESCIENNVKKIIFSSSSEVYGEPLKVPTDENQPIMPITNYGISKVTAEEYIKGFAQKYGLKYNILRFFNAYGPQQSTEFVVPEFVDRIIKELPISIHGSGSQIRSFCHIDDIVNGISLCLNLSNDEIFNIGNGNEPITIKDLAEKIMTLCNIKTKIEFVPFENSKRKRRKEIMKRRPNVEKAKRILGYEPRVSLNEGIKTVIEERRK